MSVFAVQQSRETGILRSAGTAVQQAAGRAPAPEKARQRDRVNLSQEAREQERPGAGLSQLLSGLTNTYQVPDERQPGHWHVPVDESERECNPELLRRQQDTIRQMTRGGQCAEWTNGNGQREVVSLRPGENGNYELRGQDGHPIQIQLDPNLSEAERINALARITDYHTQTPNHLRDAVDEIQIYGEPAADGRAADQSDKRIRFYGGTANLNNHVFDHEFGHAVGRKLNRDAQSRMMAENPHLAMMPDRNFTATPRGYEEAAQKDILAPSQYARRGGAPEDFAEFYAAYREALEEGPEAMAALRNQYRERTAYLDGVMVPPPRPALRWA